MLTPTTGTRLRPLPAVTTTPHRCLTPASSTGKCRERVADENGSSAPACAPSCARTKYPHLLPDAHGLDTLAGDIIPPAWVG